MPKVNEMFPSKYLKGIDLNDQFWTLTIARVELVEVFIPPATRDHKWAIYFKGAHKGMILNKTNAEAMAEIFRSDDTDDWLGKRITIFPEQVKVSGAWKIGIRVRESENAGGETSAEKLDQEKDDY